MLAQKSYKRNHVEKTSTKESQILKHFFENEIENLKSWFDIKENENCQSKYHTTFKKKKIQ